MRFVLKLTGVLIVLCAVGAAAWFGYDFYQHRYVRNDADLIKLLPPGDLTTFYVNVAALRHGGLLHLFTGFSVASEKDYADFVASTNFDYARDMEALAGGFNNDGVFFLIRGRFDWDKLRQFAWAHGGVCEEDACRVPGTKPGRWVNFLRIQVDTVALAISQNSTAADLMRPPGRRLQEYTTGDPLWLSVSPALLKDPTNLPKALQIFALSLQPAELVVLSTGQAESSDEAFTVQLQAVFPNAPSADTTCKQLQLQTHLLKLALARENRQADPADLTGLLTSGTFQVGNNHVFGSWPVHKELLKTLE